MESKYIPNLNYLFQYSQQFRCVFNEILSKLISMDTNVKNAWNNAMDLIFQIMITYYDKESYN